MYGNEERLLTTQSGGQFIPTSQHAENIDHNATENQPHDILHVLTNCTTPFASLNVLNNDDLSILLTFFVSRDDDAAHMTSLICHAHLQSQPRYVISAVLLEHSLCDGGVFVLLWEGTKRTSWDVCSAWQAPGPHLVTSSEVADVNIESKNVKGPCDLTLSVRAVKKPRDGQLELWHLSATEGTVYLLMGGAGGGRVVVPAHALNFQYFCVKKTFLELEPIP